MDQFRYVVKFPGCVAKAGFTLYEDAQDYCDVLAEQYGPGIQIIDQQRGIELAAKERETAEQLVAAVRAVAVPLQNIGSSNAVLADYIANNYGEGE